MAQVPSAWLTMRCRFHGGYYGTAADRFAMSRASGLIAAALVRKS